MNCPACNEPMVVLELDRIEIDHCLACGGIWLDGGELELLLESAHAKNHLLNSVETIRRSGEKLRKCPICLKKMEKVLFEKKVCVDKCRRSHGLWFDCGELQTILAIEVKDDKNRTLRLLQDMFKKKD